MTLHLRAVLHCRLGLAEHREAGSMRAGQQSQHGAALCGRVRARRPGAAAHRGRRQRRRGELQWQHAAGACHVRPLHAPRSLRGAGRAWQAANVYAVAACGAKERGVTRARLEKRNPLNQDADTLALLENAATAGLALLEQA